MSAGAQPPRRIEFSLEAMGTLDVKSQLIVFADEDGRPAGIMLDHDFYLCHRTPRSQPETSWRPIWLLRVGTDEGEKDTSPSELPSAPSRA